MVSQVALPLQPRGEFAECGSGDDGAQPRAVGALDVNEDGSYVQYAKDLYGNWMGHEPAVAGDRNRMPLSRDREGWPRLPAEQQPGPMKYWREHSVGEIGARVAGGCRQMAIDLRGGLRCAGIRRSAIPGNPPRRRGPRASE